MNNTDLTVSARQLTRNFGGHRAVRGVTLELKRGEVLGLLGPNGAGKTTTMQMLTGNLAPTFGEISICGVDLLEEPKSAKARIGYLPEVPPLYKEFSVDEFLGFAARLHRVRKSSAADAVTRAKQRCGLHDTGNRLIGSLSKGYQQRVGIAQAIIHSPDVVILYEPTVGLDPNQIREIRELVRELGRDHSVILSTHILPEVEAVCDRVQILHHGAVVYADSIEGLRKFRGGQSLLVGLRRPPSVAEIEAVTGVARVEAQGDHLLRVMPREGMDPTGALVSASVAGSWGLFQLQPGQTSLEEVFAQLTERDDDNTQPSSKESAK
jgi:ABC-2 type transport system ATP-binding protein